VRAGTAALGLALAVAAAPARGGEIPEAVLVLETSPETPGAEKSGAPVRFALLKNGRVFVGGTSLLEAGHLEKEEASELRRRAEDLARRPGFSETISLGGDAGRLVRLRLLEGRRFDLRVTGDPATAPDTLTPVSSLLSDLMGFHHPSLRPFVPASYALGVREATLTGGCRPWTFSVPLADALAGPNSVPARDAEGWPTGALPASVCEGARRYVVTLRPLLPGEQP
jgi:hypothetical protein